MSTRFFRRPRAATAGLPKAAMFELRDRGYGAPFEQLAAALLSAGTRRPSQMLDVFVAVDVPSGGVTDRR